MLTLTDCFEYDEKTYNYYGSYSFTGTKIEQAVVTAILNVTTDDKVVVDMIKGNNEQDYSSLKTLLENNAYQVNEVSLATGDFDSNAKIAIMYAPSVDLDERLLKSFRHGFQMTANTDAHSSMFLLPIWARCRTLTISSRNGVCQLTEDMCLKLMKAPL